MNLIKILGAIIKYKQASLGIECHELACFVSLDIFVSSMR